MNHTSAENKDVQLQPRPAAALAICGCVLVAILAGLGFQISPGDDSAGKPTARATTVNVLVAHHEDSVQPFHAFPGVVKASRATELSFDRPGRVAELMIQEGDTVAADAPLAELTKQRLEAQQASLETARKRAADSLAELDPEAPALTVDGMEATIQQLRGELNQLAGDVASSRQPGQPADLQSLQRRLQSVEARIDAMNEASRQQKINELQRLLDQLDGQLTDVGLELDSCTLTAPFAGTIAQCYVDQGAVVSAGMPVVRLVATDSLEVWLGIPADDAATVEAGKSYDITVGDRRYAGTATGKLPEIDRSTRTRTVVFQLPADASDQLLPGGVARVEVPSTINSEGFWLPLTALMREAQGLWSVYVVKSRDGAKDALFVSRRYVEIVHLEAARALVRGTLDEGELVIANGTHRVVPGQQVQCNEVELEAEQPGGQSP